MGVQESQQSFQEEMLSLILEPLFAQVTLSAEGKALDPLWSKLWSLNPEILKMEMVNLLFSKDHSVYDQVLEVCKSLKVMTYSSTYSIFYLIMLKFCRAQLLVFNARMGQF